MADQKITQLTALTTASSDDILPIVDDPSGTPVTKKITISNLAAALASLLGNPEVPSGAVNASNTVFTVAAEPKFIVVDGSIKFSTTLLPTAGAYTYSTGTITIIDGAAPRNYIISIP